MDILSTIIDLMAIGLPALVVILVGDFILQKVKGGAKIPILGPWYVSKSVAFVALFISILVTGWIFQYLQVGLKNWMVENPVSIIIVLIAAYIVFNIVFYRK